MSSSRLTRPLFFALSLVILMGASSSFAQFGGVIGIFGDVEGLNCNLLDGGAPSSWHIVHRVSVRTTRIDFTAALPACSPVIFLGDVSVFPVTIGNSQTGVQIEYGSCTASPIHVLTVITFGGGTPACCEYPMTPHPQSGSGQIETFDCPSNNLRFATGRTTRINPNATCLCTVATEQSTWGHVKALYAE